MIKAQETQGLKAPRKRKDSKHRMPDVRAGPEDCFSLRIIKANSVIKPES